VQQYFKTNKTRTNNPSQQTYDPELCAALLLECEQLKVGFKDYEDLRQVRVKADEWVH